MGKAVEVIRGPGLIQFFIIQEVFAGHQSVIILVQGHVLPNRDELEINILQPLAKGVQLIKPTLRHLQFQDFLCKARERREAVDEWIF